MFSLRLRPLVLATVSALLILGAIKYGPIYLSVLEFDDFVEHEVKFAFRARHSTEEVRTVVVKKAKELEIDIHPRDVHITKKGPSFSLSLTYTMPVDMWLYRHELTFNCSSSGEVFGN